MEETMKIIKEISELIEDVKATNILLPEITIEKRALKKVPTYLKDKGYKKVVIVADDNTNEVAAKQLSDDFSGVCDEVKTVLLKPTTHGQVIADEQTLVQLLIETPEDTDVILAVGSGTIHDVVRFVGYKMSIPFVSIPTAASVDGFTSKGAPLILRGVKQTIQTASPIAVFADIDVLVQAPRELTAAGFGDILGKYTSLLDWKISDLVGGEPYSQRAADMTRRTLENCVRNADKIANGDDEGIKILIQSLIESGLVMLVLDFSRPASGAEHHLSHYWEMDLLNKDAEQLLHGAKVGVSTTIITELYKLLAQYDIDNLPTDYQYKNQLKEHWLSITTMIDQLPEPSSLKKLLEVVGGPTTTDELCLANSLVQDSLNEAFTLRDRCTGLLIINQLKRAEINFPIEVLELA